MNKEKCYDIGVIQAFIDGELASDLQENVVGHIALCDSCATLLADSEEESAFAFSVLDEELNVLVPTERLRTKVFESINESKEKVSIWQTITNSLGLAGGFSFKSPSLVAFASLFLFVSALGVGVTFYEPMVNDNEVAKVNVPNIQTVDVKDTPYRTIVAKEDSVPSIDKTVAKKQNTNKIRVIKTGGIKKADKKRGGINKGGANPPKDGTDIKPPVDPLPAPSSNLSGEDSYLQTIATLKRTVDANKDLSLRPRERVAFERDMAVVDDAIKKMKKEVRKNPKNKAAREILRSSYKNKIDLLNSVAEKTELMASIE